MIEDGIDGGVPALGRLVVGLLWQVGGGTFFYLPSQTRQFSKVQFPIGFGFWIVQFTESNSKLPKIRTIANLLSSKLLRWKLENPKISQAQNSPNSPKNLSISNPVVGFWIFQFTESPSQLPKICPIANLLSSKFTRVEIGKSKNLPIAQNSPNFQSRRQSPISNFQSPKIIQPERYCARSANYYY